MTMDRSPEDLRVVVVDDHPLYRDGLVATLDDLDGVHVVAQASNGEEGIAATAAMQPDVVLMDLHMPGMDGIEATRRITESHPQTRVLVLTMVEDEEALVAATSAGARGYLLKEATSDEIVRALRAVADGQVIFGGRAAGRVLATLASGSSRRGLAGFTDREHEVLHLLAQGLTNTTIAERLVVSDKTVRNYVSGIFTKLGVTDRAAAVVRAREAGYGRGRHR